MKWPLMLLAVPGPCLVFRFFQSSQCHPCRLPYELSAIVHQLWRQDPVHTVNLQEYLVSQINQCQQIHGQPAFSHLMDRVDPEVFTQLKAFVHWPRSVRVESPGHATSPSVSSTVVSSGFYVVDLATCDTTTAPVSTHGCRICYPDWQAESTNCLSPDSLITFTVW